MSDRDTPTPEKPFYEASIRLDKLPVDGRAITIDAVKQETDAIAQRMNATDVPKFSARINARPIKGGVQISGRIQAQIVQPCVVTFEPVTEEIDETFERVFLNGAPGGNAPKPGSEVFVDLEGDDLPDYFEGSEVDLTELLMEILALNMSSYPRAEGAEPVAGDLEEQDKPASPFSVLEQLKNRGD